jgi:hypothetical protein
LTNGPYAKKKFMTNVEPTLSDQELENLLNEIGTLPKPPEKTNEKGRIEELIKKISLEKKTTVEKKGDWLFHLFIFLNLSLVLFLTFSVFSLRNEVSHLADEIEARPPASLYPACPKEEIIESLDGDALYKKSQQPV